jgi:hypothetical protein
LRAMGDPFANQYVPYLFYSSHLADATA